MESIVSRVWFPLGEIITLIVFRGVLPDGSSPLPTILDTFLDVFATYRDHPISFTDATTVALMDAQGIDLLLSFDSDFDGIVERLAPETLANDP